jgi:putative inorganic carbon (HCO3(-)) transporter
VWLQFGHERLRSQIGFLPPPFIVFFGIVTLSSLPTFQLAGDYRYFFLGCMHYLMVLDLFSDGKRIYFLYLLLALSPGILVIRGLLHDPAILNIDLISRFGFPLDHPNTAGYIFAMAIPLCVAVAIAEKGTLRMLSLLSCATQLSALILTYSRGAWLGWAGSMLFLGVTLKRRKEVAVIVIVAGLLLFFATPIRDRLFTLIGPPSDDAIHERVQAMKAGIELGFGHSVLGVGYGRGYLREALREKHGTAAAISNIAHTHNVYVELFAETGFLGLGAFLWLLGHGLRQALSNARGVEGANRVFQLGIAAAWIAFAVTGLGDVPFFHHETRIFFFTLLALVHLYGPRGVFNRSRVAWPLNRGRFQ